MRALFLNYRVPGQRKLVCRSSLAGAKVAADGGIDKITEGQGEVLNLKADATCSRRVVLNFRDGKILLRCP